MTSESASHAPGTVWTYPPSQILVPVDFGGASARALQVAAALARAYTAGVIILHADAIEAPAYFTRDQASALERQRAQARTAAERELTKFARRFVQSPQQVRFVEDSPATAIVEASRRADLIVMGTHGRRGPSRWWLGSVAERVVRESSVPVLVVRAVADGAPAEAVFARPLMVVGQWAFEGDAGRYAAGLAGVFNGAVADEAIACQEDLARERAASLLVIARDARAGWFGASAERLVRSCALPMLFVPSR